MPSPKIFVSHSHKDNVFCRRFVNQLKARGYDVWYDEHSLGSGALRDAIDHELVARQHFIVIFSPDALVSPWVKDEMEGALKRFNQGKMQTFLPIIARPCDVPPSLERYKRVEGPDGAAVSVEEAVARVQQVIPLPPPDPPPPQPAPKVAAPQPRYVAPPAPPTTAPAPQRSPTPSAPAINPTLTRRALLATGAAGATVVVLGGGFYWFTHGTSTLVPASLQTLGFVGKVYGSVKVIIPPTVNVPAGPFLMGSDPAKDPGAISDEEPQSTITIASAYQIGQYHVTVAEYALAVQAGAVRQPPDNGPTWQTQLNTPDHPVVYVAWTDVVQYAAWLAKITGDPWRLPTEAEWEKAARGTDGRIYPWGNQWDSAKANTSEGGPGTTTPVGAYAAAGDASPYGAHDMAGNVWQWCSTIYDQTKFPYPYNANDGRENMSDTTSLRVLRGGSWINVSRNARAAYRDRLIVDVDHLNCGFRHVRGVGAGSH